MTMAIQTTTMCSRGGSLCERTARYLVLNNKSKGNSRFYSNIWWNHSDEQVMAVVPRMIMSLSSLSSPALSWNHHYHHHRRRSRRCMSSTTPFYGTPLPPSSRYNETNTSLSLNNSTQQQQQHHHLPPLTPLQRLATLVHSSLTALNDPTRADAVAAVGEVTGSYALSKMMAGMEQDEVGRRILKERPIVDESVASRAMELLRRHDDDEIMSQQSNVNIIHNPINGGKRREKRMTFGAAYATFLQTHDYDPNERSAVRFIPDQNLSYVMTRYRQCHDYWHVLTGLPPTVLGELGLKWLELMQTGLPLAALSASGGALGGATTTALGLSDREREVLLEVYLPWAVEVGSNMRENVLMCTYYEEELETDLGVLRERMGIEAAPTVYV